MERRMKIHNLSAYARISGGTVLFLACSLAIAAPAVKDKDMGLSKTSVFDSPVPKAYHYGALPPGKSEVLPRGYPGAPPQIPHDIAYFLPITAQSNQCIVCHNRPDERGKPHAAGVPTPMPVSHYTDLRNEPGKVTDHLIGARYNCNQCHVPQTDAPALVGNTFSSGDSR
jgi:cytochrome c-type protein NapB